MNDRKFEMNRDGLGLLLFALGLFPAVLIVKALLSAAPIESITGDGPIALSWIRTLGALPSLLLTGGILFLGGRLFLFGQRDNLVRDALGIAGLALATSILFGAFSPTAGGNIGFATGGLVSSAAHVAVGALFGLIAVGVAIWFPWLREERAPRIATVPEEGTGAVLDEEDDTGVSAEEAAALIPEDFNRAIDEGRKQLTIKPVRSVPPPSPYPEDVRLKGQIPPGARPLNAEQNVRTEPESAPQPSSVYRWTAPRTDVPGDAADEDLARLPEPEVVFAAEPFVSDESWSDTTATGGAQVADTLERELEASELELELSASSAGVAVPGGPAELSESDPAAGVSIEPADVLPGALPGVLPDALPRPSWEQSSLFVESDEPVDAYGTPLTLVEALRHEGGTAAITASNEPAPESGAAVSALPTETDFSPELEAGSEDEPEFEDVRLASVRAAGADLDDEDLVDEEDDLEGDDVLDGEMTEAEAEIEASEDEDGDEEADEDDDEHEDGLEEEEEADEEEETEVEVLIHGEAESEDEKPLADDGDETEEPIDIERRPLSAVGAEPVDAETISIVEGQETETETEPAAETAAIPAAASPAAAKITFPAAAAAALPTLVSATGDDDADRSARPAVEVAAKATGRRDSVAASATPISTSIPTPTSTPISTPRATPASTATSTPTWIPTPTPTPSLAPSPSLTPSLAPSPSLTPAPTLPSSPTPTPTDGPLVDLMEQRSSARSDRPTKTAAAELSTEIKPSKPARPAPVAKSGGSQAAGREREVILEPRATPPEKAIKSQPVLPERAELLRDAGCLFVDRGRVAVSMLQRQYAMDFDQACEVLDELQNLGLIGPYLGGQRRDILLTREQWLEKVGSA